MTADAWRVVEAQHEIATRKLVETDAEQLLLEGGIWYGSESLPTAFAEVADYRLLFLEGTEADLGPVVTEMTSFRITLRTTRGLDLTAARFAANRIVLAETDSYAATQRLGSDMRQAGVQAFRYRSARDTDCGVNVGAFESPPFPSA